MLNEAQTTCYTVSGVDVNASDFFVDYYLNIPADHLTALQAQLNKCNHQICA